MAVIAAVTLGSMVVVLVVMILVMVDVDLVVGSHVRGSCHGRGCNSRLCTNYRGTSHTVKYCYNLHGFPQAH